MKSRLINTVCAIGQQLPLRDSNSGTAGFSSSSSLSSRVSRAVLALGGTVCVLTLSGCYYPYGYYPAGYQPYYATVPAGATQQAAPVGQDDYSASQQQQQQQLQQQQQSPQQQAQAQVGQQAPPPTYAVAAPPVYVAPAYPAYYPPPVYPAYYGYPGWYGPSVSVGFAFGGYWGGHGGGGWGGHGHWH